jgi:hypothetical protein
LCILCIWSWHMKFIKKNLSCENLHLCCNSKTIILTCIS